MALITLWDGRVENVNDNRDMLYLVDEYMGMEARWWFEDEAEAKVDFEKDYDELWKDYEKQQEEHKDVIREIQTEANKISDLLRLKRLNRKAMTDVLKTLENILWRELR